MKKGDKQTKKYQMSSQIRDKTKYYQQTKKVITRRRACALLALKIHELLKCPTAQISHPVS